MKETDILILGAGCAGLTAGIYAARAGRRVTILEQGLPGGQAALTAQIDNYPGIARVDGVSLMQTMTAQAEHFGAEIVYQKAAELDAVGRAVTTERSTVQACAIIAAMGATPRRLGIPGEAALTGRGVSYCATCDGFFYLGKEIFVVGGGDSAAEEALHLAEISSGVRMLVRKGSLRCQASIADKVRKHPKIQLCFHTELAELRGDRQLEEVVLRNALTGECTTENARGCGVFVFAGYEPASQLLAGKAALDSQGYVITDGCLQTSLPGIFAAGDVRRKPLRQLITAAADGAEAAFHACKFCADML